MPAAPARPPPPDKPLQAQGEPSAARGCALDLTRIIAGLDKAFDVRITTGDIEPENFNSAEAMLALVRRYRERA